MSPLGAGILFAFCATLGLATSGVLGRIGLQHMRTGPGTLVSLVAGLLLVGSITFAVHGREVFAVSAVALGWFALLGAINFPLGRFFGYHAMKLMGVTRSTPIIAVAVPLMAPALAFLVASEIPSLLTMVGIVAVVSGIALTLSEAR